MGYCHGPEKTDKDPGQGRGNLRGETGAESSRVMPGAWEGAIFVGKEAQAC